MAKFLYYLAQKPGHTPGQLLDAAGIRDRFDGQPATREIRTGPDDGPGILFCQAPADDADAYLPAGQTWQKFPAFWLGWDPEDLPGPEDLDRLEILEADWLKLGDGRVWKIPVARVFPSGSRLPDALILGDDGQVCRETLPKFAALSALGDRIWDVVRSHNGNLEPGETVEPMDDAETFEACRKILAAGYRLGGEEISALGLLSLLARHAILMSFVDFHTFAAVQGDPEAKKNEPDDGPGLPEDTSPASCPT